jgi:hypothetical protein
MQNLPQPFENEEDKRWNDSQRLRANLQALLHSFYEYCHFLFPYKPGVPFNEQAYSLHDYPFMVPLISAVYKAISDPNYSLPPEGLLFPESKERMVWLKGNYERTLSHPTRPLFYRCAHYGKLDRTGALPTPNKDPEMEDPVEAARMMMREEFQAMFVQLRGNK